MAPARTQPSTRAEGRFVLRAWTVRAAGGGTVPDGDDIGADPVLVVVPLDGSVALRTDRSDGLVAPGALALVDGRSAFSCEPSGPCELALLALPRTLLTEPDSSIRRTAGRPLDAERGTASLVASAVVSLCRAPRPERGLPDPMTYHVADLLSTLIVEVGDETPDSARDNELMADIRWYVNCHLGDPELSPERIAAAHFVSVRYLHKLFEGEGTTLARWIQRRRLHECRRELGRVGQTPVKVATVAQRWGFVNAAHFSRAFRTAFGMSPRDWREARSGLPRE